MKILGFALILLAVVLFLRSGRRKEEGPFPEEALTQDMYRILEKLEKRVEVLETLLSEDKERHE